MQSKKTKAVIDNNKYVIGIDPGLSGAICLYNITQDKVIEVLNTPIYKKDKKSWLDGINILNKLKEWKLKTSNVVIESQTVTHRDGGKSTITTLRNYGYLLGLLDSLEFNVLEVAPTTWQSIVLKDVIDPGEPIKLKPTKRKSIIFASRLFNPKNDGQSDAYGLCAYYKMVINK